jgi:hypothetical protein
MRRNLGQRLSQNLTNQGVCLLTAAYEEVKIWSLTSKKKKIHCNMPPITSKLQSKTEYSKQAEGNYKFSGVIV